MVLELLGFSHRSLNPSRSQAWVRLKLRRRKVGLLPRWNRSRLMLLQRFIFSCLSPCYFIRISWPHIPKTMVYLLFCSWQILTGHHTAMFPGNHLILRWIIDHISPSTSCTCIYNFMKFVTIPHLPHEELSQSLLMLFIFVLICIRTIAMNTWTMYCLSSQVIQAIYQRDLLGSQWVVSEN